MRCFWDKVSEIVSSRQRSGYGYANLRQLAAQLAQLLDLARAGKASVKTP
jgi:hypothetical protein